MDQKIEPKFEPKFEPKIEHKIDIPKTLRDSEKNQPSNLIRVKTNIDPDKTSSTINLLKLGNENSLNQTNHNNVQSQSNNFNNYNNFNKWNKRTELFLQKIHEKTSAYRWMHDQEYNNCDRINDLYSSIEVILFSILAILQSGTFVTFISGGNFDDNKKVYIILNVIIMAFIVITSIVTGLKNNGEYKKKEQQHKYISTKFYEISLEIQYQFTLDMSRRDGDKEFLSKIINKFNDLLQLSLPISKKVITKFLQMKEGGNDIMMPINMNDININDDEIEIEMRDVNNVELNSSVNISPEAKIEAKINRKLNNEIDRWLKNF
jgi:hypothetical protein